MAQTQPPAILIVEDDMLFQGIYRARLAEEGYQVTTASDGEEALREMEAALPALVLLDLVLPRRNGYEVLETMQADPRLARVPVIVLSNKGEPADIKRGLELGAHDYLVKTIARPKEVLWKIRQALAEKSGQPMWLRVSLREHELDAAQLAEIAGKPGDLHCPKCGAGLVLELTPRLDRPGWFEARLDCPKCGK